MPQPGETRRGRHARVGAGTPACRRATAGGKHAAAGGEHVAAPGRGMLKKSMPRLVGYKYVTCPPEFYASRWPSGYVA